MDPDRRVSYLIITGGGLIGTEAHSVAVPSDQFREEGNRIVLPGATRHSVRSMPAFRYSASSATHDNLVVNAKVQLELAKGRIEALQRKGSALTDAKKLRVEGQLSNIAKEQMDVERRLAEMDSAGPTKWWQFEDALRAATYRLRKTIAIPLG